MTNDVPELAQQAIAQVKKARPGELIILDAILVELFFVLEANPHYKFPRDKSAVVFTGILSIPQFKISEQAKEAFGLFKVHRKLDFMDCLLIIAAGSDPQAIVSFDKDLLKTASV